MSSTAMVSIEVSDINDNPPTFFPANLTAVIQVNMVLTFISSPTEDCDNKPKKIRFVHSNLSCVLFNESAVNNSDCQAKKA